MTDLLCVFAIAAFGILAVEWTIWRLRIEKRLDDMENDDE